MPQNHIDPNLTLASASGGSENKQHSYTSGDIGTLLDRYLDDKENVGISDFVFLERRSDAYKSFKEMAEMVKNGEYESVVVPLHVYGPDHPHWTMAVIRKRADGALQMLYNDSGSGSGHKGNEGHDRHSLLGHPDSDNIINAIKEVDESAQIVDLKHRQQNGGQECGAFVVDNLIRLSNASAKQLDDLGDEKISSNEVLYSPTDYHGKETFSGDIIRRQHAYDNPDLPLDEDVTRQVNKIVESNKLSELYTPSVVDSIKSNLYQQIVEKRGSAAENNEEVKEFIGQIKAVFAQRAKLMADFGRVIAKEEAIKKFDKDGAKASEIMAANIASEVDTLTLEQLDRSNPDSIKKIRESELVPTHINEPAENYKFLVGEAKFKTKLEMASNDKRLEILLGEGRALSDAEEEELKDYESSLNHSDRFTPHMLKAAKARIAGDDEEKLKYSQRRQDLISSRNAMLLSAAASLGLSGDQLRRVKDRIENEMSGDVIFDYASFEKMKKIIDEEAKGLDEKQKKVKDDFDKKISDMESGLNKEEKALLGEGSELLQGRLLMLFLGLTPFGIFANIFGGILNYPDVLSDLFGSIFDSTPIPEKISNTLTGFNPFGIPIGDVLEKTKIPYALEWLMENTPVVSQILEIPQLITDNDIVKTGIPLIDQMLFKNAIIPFVAAGWYGYYHMGKELDHASKESTFIESQEKKHKSAVDNFVSNYNELGENAANDLAKKRLESMKSAYRSKKLAELIVKSDEETLEQLFGDSELVLSDKSKANLKKLKQDGKLKDVLNVVDLLESRDNASVNATLSNSFLVYEQAQSDIEKYKEVVAEFSKKNDEILSEKKELIEKKQKQNATEAAVTDDEIEKLKKKAEELSKSTYGKRQEQLDRECLDLLANSYSIKSLFEGDQRYIEIENNLLWRYTQDFRELHQSSIGKPKTTISQPIDAKKAKETKEKAFDQSPNPYFSRG